MRHLILMCLAISLMTGLSGSDARATEVLNSTEVVVGRISRNCIVR